MYYRDFIVRRFRENPARKITFTEVRRSLVGDVGSVRRVFDFLETWGLINYTGSEKQGAKAGVEDKEKRGTDEGTANGLGVVKSFCTTCKSECNIVCFATEKVSSLIFGFWSHFLRISMSTIHIILGFCFPLLGARSYPLCEMLCPRKLPGRIDTRGLQAGRRQQ